MSENDTVTKIRAKNAESQAAGNISSFDKVSFSNTDAASISNHSMVVNKAGLFFLVLNLAATCMHMLADITVDPSLYAVEIVALWTGIWFGTKKLFANAGFLNIKRWHSFWHGNILGYIIGQVVVSLITVSAISSMDFTGQRSLGSMWEAMIFCTAVCIPVLVGIAMGYINTILAEKDNINAAVAAFESMRTGQGPNS